MKEYLSHVLCDRYRERASLVREAKKLSILAKSARPARPAVRTGRYRKGGSELWDVLIGKHTGKDLNMVCEKLTSHVVAFLSVAVITYEVLYNALSAL